MQSTIKSAVLPAQRTLLGQQVARAMQLQKELLSDPLVDVKTAALSLGGCSYATLNRLVRENRLKVFRIGPRGKRKVRRSSLRALLAQGEHAPQADARADYIQVCGAACIPGSFATYQSCGFLKTSARGSARAGPRSEW